jgi:hypothetical protein
MTHKFARRGPNAIQKTKAKIIEPTTMNEELVVKDNMRRKSDNK